MGLWIVAFVWATPLFIMAMVKTFSKPKPNDWLPYGLKWKNEIF